jgi:hypothetical protein
MRGGRPVSASRLVGRSALVAAMLLGAVGIMLTTDARSDAAGGQRHDEESAWDMHPIDGQYRGANSLGAGDVNGDGLTDYSVNYEFDQRYVVYLHPGESGDVRLPWPRVVLVPSTLEPGRGAATESSALGDLDGDGNVDLVGAQSGDQLRSTIGNEPGLRIFWGPEASQALDAAAWTDAGRITETVDAGHYHWVVTRDVDEDGDLDVMAGGRILVGTADPTGLLWIESPDDPVARRDLSQWRVHEIDGDTTGGHGFAFSDVDEDGDDDLLEANADFDTADRDENVAWYENPGPGTDEQRAAWAKEVLYKSPDFTVKPQIGVGDLDADGLVDFVTQTPNDLIVFRKTSSDPVRFDVIEVPKPKKARWTPRTVRVADINGDDRLDVVGMLSHQGSDVPTDKASMFWMELNGDRITPDSWTTHVVHWGPGRVMSARSLGSKWDQADVTDVDRDGDLDIVANNEEWWVEDNGELTAFDDPNLNPESMPLVWFENRLDEKSRRCAERRDTCDIQAEHTTAIHDGTWVERAQYPGADGAYLQVFNGLNPTIECRQFRLPGQCPKLAKDGTLTYGTTEGVEYDLSLDGGTYSVWARVFVPATHGQYLGGARSDSVFVALDGSPVVLGEGTPPGAWTWVKADGTTKLDEGRHTLTLRARDRGFAVDEIVITSDRDYQPQ